MKNKSDDYWRQKLTPEQYHVLREKGTQWPFAGAYLEHNDEGEYNCAGCGAKLFKSNSKYETQTPSLAGWPSFAEAISSGSVKLQDDNNYGMHRIEVVCTQCGGHLGHLFDDDSSPTGKHYCVNSCALDFEPKSLK